MLAFVLALCAHFACLQLDHAHSARVSRPRHRALYLKPLLPLAIHSSYCILIGHTLLVDIEVLGKPWCPTCICPGLTQAHKVEGCKAQHFLLASGGERLGSSTPPAVFQRLGSSTPPAASGPPDTFGWQLILSSTVALHSLNDYVSILPFFRVLLCLFFELL